MVRHDFATRLTSLAPLVHNVYARGFYHGVVFAIACVLLIAWWVRIGSQS